MSTPQTDIDFDKLVTKELLPRLRTAKDYNDQGEIADLISKIETALVGCSARVVQLCAKEGIYANGEPINVGQRNLSQ